MGVTITKFLSRKEKIMGDGGGQYYPPVDPGGAQKASTAASALGFVALVGSGTGTAMESALGLGAHAPQIATAGLSLVGLGGRSLFCVGLVLVGAGILLNIVSLELHRRARKEYQERTGGDYKPPTYPSSPPSSAGA
jgi:hypothetical protein